MTTLQDKQGLSPNTLQNKDVCRHCSCVKTPSSHVKTTKTLWDKFKIGSESVFQAITSFFDEKTENFCMAFLTIIMFIILFTIILCVFVIFCMIPFLTWFVHTVLWVESFVYDVGCFKFPQSREQQQICEIAALVSVVRIAGCSLLIFWFWNVIRMSIRNYKSAIQKLNA